MPDSLYEALKGVYTSHTINLLRLAAGTQAAIVEILGRMVNELVAKLNREDLTEVQRTRFRSLLAGASEITGAYYAKAGARLAETLQGLASLEAKFANSTVNKVLAADVMKVFPSTNVLEKLATKANVLGAPTASWWAKQADDVAFKYVTEVQQGIAASETNAKIISRVWNRDGNGVLNRIDGNAEALVRSSVQTVANKARIATFDKNSDVVKGTIWMSVLDNRTSLFCMGHDGLKWDLDRQPVGHDLPYVEPPGHWNALVAGTMIETRRGRVAIEDVRVGDEVLTHLGRFRRVYGTMSKQCDGQIRTIRAESGRLIRATDEHPCLTTAGWKRADEVKPGDELFEDASGDAPFGRKSVVAERANDYPSPFQKDEVFRKVSFSFAVMAATIDLKCDAGIFESEVDCEAVDLVLVDEGKAGLLKASEHGALCQGWIGSVSKNLIPCEFVPVGGVVDEHAARRSSVEGMGVLSLSERPVIGAAPVMERPRSGNVSGDALRPNRDAEALARSIERCLAESEFSLNLSDRFSFLDMLSNNEKLNGVLIPQIDRTHWALSEVKENDTGNYNGIVFNIAVVEDETYVANGIVVHNCRATMVPWLKTYAEMGIDLPEMSPTTRASMDGPVKADMTFGDWLDKQPVSRQDELLGVGRAQLWRDGKITLQDLLDQRGNPLSLAQLQERYSH